jgi:hypothetical protein
LSVQVRPEADVFSTNPRLNIKSVWVGRTFNTFYAFWGGQLRFRMMPTVKAKN